ncbi:MAG TPA: hypothetical protein VKV16_02270 [Solirubrobacteraceae bacterium]|nr:hypothetical protein [Solirubrobacteraceae bacterium]
MTAAFAMAIVPAASANAPTVPACTLSGTGHIQICPVVLKATAGKTAHVIVARYADFSHCDLPAPAGEPGQNSNYDVASVTINWGDGSRSTSGTAHTGTTCPGTDSTTPGENEPVTGVHRYRKRGRYTVTVSITYVRGATNTFANCATATPHDTTYDALTNCIALNAPVRSVATVVKAR